ncbi:MAG: potassium-transporting ATPase subunit F [Sulfobacillus sp.]
MSLDLIGSVLGIAAVVYLFYVLLYPERI